MTWRWWLVTGWIAWAAWWLLWAFSTAWNAEPGKTFTGGIG